MTGIPETTGALVSRGAERHADVPSLIFYDETVSYRDLDQRSDAMAAFLVSAGVGKGDRVAFMMGNSPAFFTVMIGTQKVGAIAVPVSCWWQAPEVRYLIGDCEPALLVVDADHAPLAQQIAGDIPSVREILVHGAAADDSAPGFRTLVEAVEPAGQPRISDPPGPGDLAAVMYTSGTTGEPKGVELTHRGIVTGARLKTASVAVQTGERALCVLPLFHSGGLNDLAFPTLYAGGTIVLRKSFSASEFWECVERYRVNAFYIVPTMWNILLRAPDAADRDTGSLRFGVSGAAPIPPEQLDECERRFGVPILEGYGQTETSGGITVNRLDRRKAGSVGVPLPEIEVEIRGEDDAPVPLGQPGEIVVRGDTVMRGYRGATDATEATLAGGWLRTGDIGYTDEEGFLYLVDRKKDLIIRGGVNVYPQEIENVIGSHRAVDQVAVIPQPHDKYGQVAHAYVALRRGEDLGADGLLDYCRERLAGYKVPHAVTFRESLPVTAVGKVLKKEILRQVEQDQTAEAVDVAPLFQSMAERFLPEKAGDTEAVVSYQITGAGGGEWTVTIAGARLTLAEGLADSPRVLVVARDRDYHDIMTGELDGITAMMTGRLRLEGDMSFMAELRQMMRPVGGHANNTEE